MAASAGTGAPIGVIPLCERGIITDPVWTRDFLRMLEEECVESVWMPEHVVMAQDYEPRYEYSADGRAPVAPTTVMPDPLQWLGFAAALTERLKLCTGVLIGPQHSAAILAKRLATLDALSQGRVAAGIGIGWQKEEYEAVGVPYEQRGRRLDELLDAMRALWRDDPASFRGEFVCFEKVFCDTKPHRPTGIPLLIGGSSEAAARRAGLRGDGYYPYTISPERLAERVAQMQEVARTAGRDPSTLPVTIWAASYRADGNCDAALLRDFAQAGASRFLFAAHEAPDRSLAGIRSFIGEFRERLAAVCS